MSDLQDRFLILGVIILFFIVTILIYRSFTEHESESVIHSNKNTPQTKLVILYNRVPKCGSSLMNSLFRKLSENGKKYIFLSSKKFKNYDFPIDARTSLLERILAEMGAKMNRTWLFAQHFYYINFGPSPRLRFEYINQVRDPIKQAVSLYGYNRALCLNPSTNARCTIANKNLWNVSLESCLSSTESSRCLSPEYGVWPMFRFFCGYSEVCTNISNRKDQEVALLVAKRNIERHYAYVGVLEYLERSLELLEHIYPLLFQGIHDTYVFQLGKTIVYATQVQYRQSISNKTVEVLRTILKYEYDLYNFILKKFAKDYYRAFNRDVLIDER